MIRVPRWRVTLVCESSDVVRGPAASIEVATQVAQERLAHLDREAILAVYMINGRVSGTEIVALGGVNGASVRPREVFRGALVAGASHLILAHCHPSGDPTPSADDDRMTEMLAKAGEMIGIPLVDHIVVGCGTADCFSYAAHARL
jgi:DNA repair protein RadC